MDKKKIFAIAIFFIMGFFMFTFANPSEETEKMANENIEREEKQEEIKPVDDEQFIAAPVVANIPIANIATPVIQPTMPNVPQIIVNTPKDIKAPVIILNGGDLIIRVKDKYEELGAKATDDIDGDISKNIVISGNVDTETKGKYTINYDVTDKAGNEAQTVTRTVTVVDVTELEKAIEDATSILDNDNKSSNEELNDLLDELNEEKSNGEDIIENEKSLQDKVDEETNIINEIIEKIKNLDFVVSFVDYDDSEISSQTIKYYESAIKPEDPTRKGYNFEGWDGKYTNVVDNEIVKATYSAISYNISYNLNGGNNVTNPTKYTIEDEITLNNPTKEGYDFDGWYNGNDRITEIKEMTGDLELVAHYTESTNTLYKVTIKKENLDGKYVTTSNNYRGTTNSLVNYNILEEGFTINDESITSGNIKADGSLELVVIYDRNSYNLIVDGKSTSVKYEKEISLTKPSKQGYDFVKYDVEVPSTMPNHDVVINSLWNAHEYTISYNDELNAVNNNAKKYTIENHTIFTDLEKTGYTFAGFTYNGIKINSTNGYTEDLNIFANWSINHYTLSFDSNGGNKIDDINYTILDSVNLPTPVKTGYEFDGWYDGDKKVESVITGDYNLVARYNVSSYTITYNDELNVQNTNPTSYTVENNKEISDLEKAGYTFNGWYDGKTKVTSTNGYAKNLELTASWTLDKYNISYELNGGKLTKTNPSTYTINSNIILNNPTKKDYTFNGWYNGETKVTRINNMTGDLELVAKYTANQIGIIAELKNNKFLQFTKNQSVDVKDYINVYPVYADGTKGNALNNDEYSISNFSTSSVVTDKPLTITSGTYTDNSLTYSVINEKSFQTKFEVVYKPISYVTSNANCTAYDGFFGKFSGYCDEVKTKEVKVKKPVLEVIEHYDQYIKVNKVIANIANKNVQLNVTDDSVRWTHILDNDIWNPVYIASNGKLNDNKQLKDIDINNLTTVMIYYTRTFETNWYHSYTKDYVVTFENRNGVFVAIDEYEI